MANVQKRPVVIQDLIEQADYIAKDNLDVAERFLQAAESTFQKIGNFPEIGKLLTFPSSRLSDLRQYPVKGFRKCLIFYRIVDSGVEIIRVLHGSRDLVEVLIDSVKN